LRVRDHVAGVAARCGRASESISILAVSKRQPVEAIIAAHRAGADAFGENYVQEAQSKQKELAGSAECGPVYRWHLIGHLQTNKARLAVSAFDLIQSVDSAKLAAALQQAAESSGKTQDILIQVKLGDEQTKSGILPSNLDQLVQSIHARQSLRLRGLMGVAPAGEDPRPYFRLLRELYETLPSGSRHILSMGMTADYEIAIEEGATMVRVGSAIFGSR